MSKLVAEQPPGFRPNVEALEVFVMVVEHRKRSVRQMALDLGFKHHNKVLQLLKKLEKGYGVNLVTFKSGMGFSITPAGNVLYPWAKSIVEQHKQIRQWPPGRADELHV